MTTLYNYCNEFMENVIQATYKPNSIRLYKRAMKNLLEYFGTEITIEELTRLKLQAYVDTVGDNIKHHAVVFLKRILNELYMDDMIPKNYAKQLRNTKVQRIPKEKEVLTTTQVQDFFTVIRGTKREYIIRLLFFTGMRIGEVLALQWDDIKYDKDNEVVRITVTKTYNEFTKTIGTPKTLRSNRTVFLTDKYTIDLLLEQAKGRPKDQHIAINETTQRIITRKAIDLAFRKATQQANEQLNSGIQFELTPHHARVHFTSYCLAKGISQKNLQLQLGHANTHLIDTVYGKAIGDRMERLKEVGSIY